MAATERFDHKEIKSVQILRHEFDASLELQTSLRTLLNSDYSERSYFHIFGTRQIAILPPEGDLTEYEADFGAAKKQRDRQEAMLDQVKKEFARIKTPIHLEKARFRNLESYLRVMLKPAQQLVFNHMLSGIGTIPGVMQQPTQKGVGQYAYLDIPKSALLRDPLELDEAVTAFDPSKRFSMLTPIGIEAFSREVQLGPESYDALKKVS